MKYSDGKKKIIIPLIKIEKKKRKRKKFEDQTKWRWSPQWLQRWSLLSSSIYYKNCSTWIHTEPQSRTLFFPLWFLLYISFFFLFLYSPNQIRFCCLLSLSFSVLFQLSRLCFLCFTNYKGFLSLLSLFMSLCSIKWIIGDF